MGKEESLKTKSKVKMSKSKEKTLSRKRENKKAPADAKASTFARGCGGQDGGQARVVEEMEDKKLESES